VFFLCHHNMSWVEKNHKKEPIIDKLLGHIVQLSQHKFPLNVVGKCLEYDDVTERELLVAKIFVHDE